MKDTDDPPKRFGLTIGDTVRIVGRTHTGMTGQVMSFTDKRVYVKVNQLGRQPCFSPNSLRVIGNGARQAKQAKQQAKQLDVTLDVTHLQAALTDHPEMMKCLLKISDLMDEYTISPDALRAILAALVA